MYVRNNLVCFAVYFTAAGLAQSIEHSTTDLEAAGSITQPGSLLRVLK